MFKILMLAAFLPVIALGQIWSDGNNRTLGYKDTVRVPTFKADSFRVTAAWPLSMFEHCRFVVAAADTDTAGFAGDSISFRWGYQSGTIMLNASGLRDTTWDGNRVVVDTFTRDSTACVPVYVGLGGLTTYTRTLKRIDTLNVTGYAVQSRVIQPEWDVVVRLWFQGLTANNKGSFLKLMATMVRRVAD